MLIFHDIDKSSAEVLRGDDFLTVPDGYYIDNENLDKSYLFVTDAKGTVYVTTYDKYNYMYSLYNGDLRYIRKIKSLISDNVIIDLKHSKSYIKNDDEDSETLSHYNFIVVINDGYTGDGINWDSLLSMVENDELPKELKLVAHENHYHNFNEYMLQDDVTKEGVTDGDSGEIESYTYPAERIYIGNPKDYDEIDTNKQVAGSDGVDYQFSIDDDGYLTIPPLIVTSAIPNAGLGQNMFYISIHKVQKEGQDDD